jgi:hypothetical protein
MSKIRSTRCLYALFNSTRSTPFSVSKARNRMTEVLPCWGARLRVGSPPCAPNSVNPRVVPGDAWARQHKADNGHLLPRAAQYAATGSRAHGRDAGLKGSDKTRQTFREQLLLFIQDPVSLCGVTRCSDRLSGTRGGIECLPGPTGQVYAGSRIRTAGNSSSTHSGE